MRVANSEVADALERIADLLSVQHASSYRVMAYRRAARTARQLERPLRELEAAEGRAGLEALPGVGKSIAAAIQELVRTGRLAHLDRLEGEVSAEALFATIPGVGPALAERIHHELDIESLEDLEIAAHDGRLEALPGFGGRRVHLIRNELEVILRRRGRRSRRVRGPAPVDQPSLGTLLEVDALYRRRAAEGTLQRIAPRRFNPEGRVWLPVLHTEKEGFTFHAMFSNTALAHRLGRTDDWVVLYVERDGEEDRYTVVTEHVGPLAGERVVRGRELEQARIGRAPASVPAQDSRARPSSRRLSNHQ